MAEFQMIMETFGGFLQKKAAEQPEHEAVVYPFHGVRHTYRDLDELTDRLAKSLLKLGVKKGDHVAVWAPNIPEWIDLLFACAKIGAVLVTVNTLYRTSELEYLLKQSDTTVFFTVGSYKTLSYTDTVYEIIPGLKECDPNEEFMFDNLPRLKRVVYIGEGSREGMVSYADIYKLSEGVSDAELEAVKSSLDIHDVINMQYTSGTTGFPKGVMLSHFNILNNAYAIGQGMNFTNMDRLCIPVPFFHCFGVVLGLMVCFSHGATAVPVESFNPVEVLKTIETERCTGVHGVPTMFISLLQLLKEQQFDTSTLRTGIMAGSPCPVEVMKAVVEKMNMADITIVYGQTEASPGMTQTNYDAPLDKRVETVGKELPGAEVMVVDPETGLECPAGVQGEIWGRGYNVMKGYYKMEEATRNAYSEDGWLKTGDLGVKTEDGYYKITGRIKDMIIRGGENIYPREIEEFLYSHPEIEDVQIVGVPDRKYGEETMAFIRTKNPEHRMTREDIHSFCKGRIADYKIPRYVEMINDYPMTASGKIQKYKLRELAAERLSQVD
jgi:fatty-acyl-CoA synthase